MIVIDCNVLVHFIAKTAHSSAVDKLYDRDPEWCAPYLIMDEFINVLSTMERKTLIGHGTTIQMAEDARELLDENLYSIPDYHTLSIAKESKCSAYDSEYIVLAEDLDIDLFTYDQQILKTSKKAKQP